LIWQAVSPATIDFRFPRYSFGDKVMSKEQKSNKEAKKKPVMTAKEKKAAKKSKKDSKGGLLDNDKH
jgi:hypothetical protein